MKARLFKYINTYNPLCPVNSPESGEIVAAFWPLPKIDPLGVYTDIVNEDKSVPTCLKAGLMPIGEPFEIKFVRPKYSTYNQEKALAYKAMHQHLLSHLNQLSCNTQ